MALEATQPLYRGVSRWLTGELVRGALQGGDRVPPERWICQELGVSRATVRRALEELVADGLVEVRGRVPFVADAVLAEPPNALVSITELARVRGLRASSRVLAKGIRPATLDEADAFGIAPGSDLFELRRVRMLDGLPIALDHNRVPARLVPGVEEVDFASASLYGALEEAGERLLRADYAIEAGLAEPDQARHLEVAPGAPVLLATTVALDADGRVLDMGHTVYRGDRYRFHATLLRRRQEERGRTHGSAEDRRRDGARARDRGRGLRGDPVGRQ
jgi:GntR family transcriptional regulator